MDIRENQVVGTKARGELSLSLVLRKELMCFLLKVHNLHREVRNVGDRIIRLNLSP